MNDPLAPRSYDPPEWEGCGRRVVELAVFFGLVTALLWAWKLWGGLGR